MRGYGEWWVNKVAPITVGTVAILQKTAACFCFILGVSLLVFLEFMESVGKLTLLFVRTVAVFYKLFAELGFLFMSRIVRIHLAGRFLSGNRVASVFGELQSSMRYGRLAIHFSHHSFRVKYLLIIKLIIPFLLRFSIFSVLSKKT